MQPPVATPAAPGAAALPNARNGTDYTVCRSGACEVQVIDGTRLTAKGIRLALHVTSESVTFTTDGPSNTSQVSGGPGNENTIGLAPFQRGDADRFYGRDTEIDALLALLNTTLLGVPGMIAVVAPSGAGKSSLLQAGLLPALEGRGLASVPGSRRWPTLVITPGQHPLSAMTREITQLAGMLGTDQEPVAPADELRAAVATYTADKVDADSRLILVVDQFEEVFTPAGSRSARPSSTYSRRSPRPAHRARRPVWS